GEGLGGGVVAAVAGDLDLVRTARVAVRVRGALRAGTVAPVLEDDDGALALRLDRVVHGRAHLALDPADLDEVDGPGAEVVVGAAHGVAAVRGGVDVEDDPVGRVVRCRGLRP